MAHTSNPALLALHGLRLKGFAEASDIAALFGFSEDEFAERLAEVSASELVIHREGRVSGWSLTAAGRIENERLLSEEIDAVGCRDLVQSVYDQFLQLNGQMLQVCTDWQVKDAEAEVLNDHGDTGYDASVLARLAVLDDAVQPLAAELLSVLHRFSVYPRRFTFALEKLLAGELEWFTKPIVESYHTVWFEMHEDLLTSLGIDRASEGDH